MKKLLSMSLMMALFATALTFSACNDDDEDGNTSNGTTHSGNIVGKTWYAYQWTIGPSSQAVPILPEKDEMYMELKLKDNKTFEMVMWDENSHGVPYQVTVSGTYTERNNTFTLEARDEEDMGGSVTMTYDKKTESLIMHTGDEDDDFYIHFRSTKSEVTTDGSKLPGQWQVITYEGLSPVMNIDFTSDGTVTLTGLNSDGRYETFTLGYTVEGGKILMTGNAYIRQFQFCFADDYLWLSWGDDGEMWIPFARVENK